MSKTKNNKKQAKKDLKAVRAKMLKKIKQDLKVKKAKMLKKVEKKVDKYEKELIALVDIKHERKDEKVEEVKTNITVEEPDNSTKE